MKAIFKAVFPFFIVSSLFLLLILAFRLNHVVAENEQDVTTTPYVEFKEVNLKQGRKVWMENCENCHAYGVGDAPIPMEPAAWDFRIKKGKAVLYEHAINGFFGPDDAMMPARGGNDALSDDDVKAAVDYMVALATHYIENLK